MGGNAPTLVKEIKSYLTEIPPNTAIFSCIGSRSWGEGRPDSDWNFVAIRLCSLDELAKFATGVENKIEEEEEDWSDLQGLYSRF